MFHLGGLRFTQLAVLSLVVACASAPQTMPDAVQRGYQSDINVLESIVEALHPGATRYHTPDEVRRLFREARTRIGRARTLGDAFLLFTELTAALRCGHTYPNFSNQRKDIARQLFGANRLPFL